MFLVVGLGNPGAKYSNTRHNAGFMLMDRLAQRTGGRFGRSSRKSFVCRTVIEGEPVLLAKPQTFMNLSGEAVRELLLQQGADPSQLLVAYDDVALPLGKIRLRKSGSAGGHKGMASIAAALGTQEVARLRLGIAGQESPGILTEYVLDEFRRSERETLEETLERAADAVATILLEGMDRAMALYN